MGAAATASQLTADAAVSGHGEGGLTRDVRPPSRCVPWAETALRKGCGETFSEFCRNAVFSQVRGGERAPVRERT